MEINNLLSFKKIYSKTKKGFRFDVSKLKLENKNNFIQIYFYFKPVLSAALIKLFLKIFVRFDFILKFLAPPVTEIIKFGIFIFHCFVITCKTFSGGVVVPTLMN